MDHPEPRVRAVVHRHLSLTARQPTSPPPQRSQKGSSGCAPPPVSYGRATPQLHSSTTPTLPKGPSLNGGRAAGPPRKSKLVPLRPFSRVVAEKRGCATPQLLGSPPTPAAAAAISRHPRPTRPSSPEKEEEDRGNKDGHLQGHRQMGQGEKKEPNKGGRRKSKKTEAKRGEPLPKMLLKAGDE